MLKPDAFFKALSDSTRLHCLLLLLSTPELCVCEIVAALDLKQPLISRHLAQLRSLRLVDDERRGQWVHYKLHADVPDWARAVLETVARVDGIAESVAAAKRRLAEASPGLTCG